jgi:hypothetical protein
MHQKDRLPDRFPAGTKYVIEGRGGRITCEYLELPDGLHVDLRAAPGMPSKARPHGRSRRVKAA